MGKSRKPSIAKKLIENSIAAMFSAIEIHNKPNFSYRYQTSIILLINSRELLLKGYIYKYHKKIKLFSKTKDWIDMPKPFLDCLSYVKTYLWKKYAHRFANIEKIYEYRCSYIHFYWDDIDPIIFLMISENIKFYIKFIKEFFPKASLESRDLLILPIWFKQIAWVPDILLNLTDNKESSKEIKKFIRSIIKTSEQLKEDWNDNWILSEYGIKLYNEKSSSNADITAKWNAQHWIAMEKVTKIIIESPSNVSNQINKDTIKKLPSVEEQKVLQEQYFPLTYKELRKKITEKYRYKFRSKVLLEELKKYKHNKDFSFACSWSTQIKYSEKLVDIIWKSLPDNPRLVQSQRDWA